MLILLRLAAIPGLAALAVPAFGQTVEIPDCPPGEPPVTEGCVEAGGILYLRQAGLPCRVVEFSEEKVFEVTKTLDPAELGVVCRARTTGPGGEARTALIGRPSTLGSTILNIAITAQPAEPDPDTYTNGDAGESVDGEPGGVAGDPPVPLAPAREITFANRASDKPWAAFDSRDASLPPEQQTALSLENVGATLDERIALRIERGIGDVTVTVVKTDDDGPEEADGISAAIEDGRLRLVVDNTSGIDAIELAASNAFGEKLALTVRLEQKYFTSDKSLAEKKTSLAHLYKLQADETFLRGQQACADYGKEPTCDYRELALERYRKAEEQLGDCNIAPAETDDPDRNPCLSETFAATLDLIRSDIAYRKALIDYRLPFFGGYSALTPTTPHHEMVKMEALLGDMTELIERIDTLRQRFATQGATQAIIAAELNYALGQYDASEIDREIAGNETDYSELDLSEYRAREDELETELKEIQGRLDALSAQQDALASQAASLTQSLISSASGVPISDVSALASGDLQTVAEAFVEQQFLSAEAPLAKDLLASSELARGVAEAVGDVQEIVAQVEDFQGKAQIIEKAVNGDRDAIRELVNRFGDERTREFVARAEDLEGKVEQAVALTKSLDQKRALAFLRSQLPAEMAEIDRIVAEVKPLEEVFETAYVAVMEKGFEKALIDEFEGALSDVLEEARPSEDEIKRMKDELKALYSVNPEQLASPYFARQAMAAIDTLQSGSEDIVSSIASLDSGFILKIPGLRPAVEKLSPGDRRKLQNALEEASERASDHVDLSGDKLCVGKRGGPSRNIRCVDFAELRRGFRQEFSEANVFAADRMNTFLSRQVDKLSDEGVLLLYLGKDGAAGFAGNLRGVFTEKDRLGDAWKRVQTRFERGGALFAQKEVREAPRVAVARLVTASAMPQPGASLRRLEEFEPTNQQPTPSRPAPPLTDPTEGGLDPATNAVVQGALNYALPGAGAALQLGQAWASMDANRELQKDYMQRLSSAVREMDQLARAKRVATREAALADLRRQRADAINRAGAQQIAKFEVALSSTMDEKKFNRELINLYRPRFYYLAERLRERFEAFDRSLADWSDGLPEGGFFQRQILANPQNARLALDSEIQLFGWLNRNIEATRTSPYALHHHWEKLVGLVQEYCSASGCKPGDGSLGQIAQTVPQYLFRDVEGKIAHSEFREWSQSRDRLASFVHFFSFAPGELGLPPSALNARILDFAIIPVDRRGKVLPGSRVQLRHDGFSTLRLADEEGQIKEARHVLVPREMPPANREQSEDVEFLRQRFQTQGSLNALLRLRDLEGYGLYGGYRLEVFDGPTIEEVDDFRLQISYIFTNPNNINSEADFVASLEDRRCGDDSGEKGPILTGVLCHSNAELRYRRLEFNESGKETCSETPLVTVRMTDMEQADFFRSLRTMACLEIEEAPDRIVEPDTPDNELDPETQDLLIDVADLRERRTCSPSEAMLIASRATLKEELACFADAR